MVFLVIHENSKVGLSHHWQDSINSASHSKKMEVIMAFYRHYVTLGEIVFSANFAT